MIDRSDAIVAWDDDDDPRGNVRHIAEHDLTPEEVESVLLDPTAEVDESSSSGRPIVMGETDTGRYIVVIFEVECEDPLVIYPVTAYEPDPWIERV